MEVRDVVDDGIECPQDARADGVDLGAVDGRELREQRLATRGEGEEHQAPVAGASLPAEEPAFLHAVDQLDRAVVENLQALGEGAHRGRNTVRHPLDREQKLMLLRLDPGGTRGLVAEPREAAQLVAKFRQGTVVTEVETWNGHTANYIV